MEVNYLGSEAGGAVAQRLDLFRFRRRNIGQDWVAIREIHLLVPLLYPCD